MELQTHQSWPKLVPILALAAPSAWETLPFLPSSFFLADAYSSFRPWLGSHLLQEAPVILKLGHVLG